MRKTNLVKTSLMVISTFVTIFLATPHVASAHCDTLDGPVIKDAQKAIETKDITPILKWVKPHDENAVRAAFQPLIAGKVKNSEEIEHKFFATLVKIHRTGEGAPFTGLKPAGAVEPAVAEADKALASGSSDALVKLITGDIESGIKQRYEHAATTFKNKDASVAQGREFVEAYVAFTHYVERIHQDAKGENAHGKHGGNDKHKPVQDHTKH